MELKPGYKKTEVGVIPEDWSTLRVTDLGKVVTGGTPRTDVKAYWNGDFPWITPTDISDCRDMWSSERRLTRKGLEAIRGLPGNAVLVTCIASIGKNAILKVEGGCNQQINAVVPDRNNNAEFLYYLFEASKQYLLANAGTTATSILSKTAFQELLFAVPPLPEQRAIAEALGDVDALIEALEKLIAKKRDLKQAVMQRLLSGQTRLPGFTGEWELKPIGEVAPLQRGFDLPTPQITQGCYPVVYSNGVLNYHARFMVRGPGVVTGRSGTIGNVHFIEQDFWPHNTTLWVTNFKGNVPKFIFYLLTTINLERFSTGSGVPTLNRNDVHGFAVRIPSRPDEQMTIAGVLSDMDAEIAALEQRLAKTRALKQGMMQELLTGSTRLV